MESKKLSLKEMEEIEGRWAGECFFAIPLFAVTAGAGSGNYAQATARIAYCWVT